MTPAAKPDCSAKLKEIRERCDAATPGPWEIWLGHETIHAAVTENSLSHISHGVLDENGDVLAMTIGVDGGDYDAPNDEVADAAAYADRVFVASCREDVPFLLGVITEYERQREELRELCERLDRERANQNLPCGESRADEIRRIMAFDTPAKGER